MTYEMNWLEITVVMLVVLTAYGVLRICFGSVFRRARMERQQG
ncbi:MULTISPECIES: hypothetical protein [Methylococcus]|uniref:Uncharacterized protein n=1 Tax=Methylococcus capsulatus TaxID=414 RepID=A0ABZ2F2R3_METCP|nr:MULTISPECIES: hypothetical protein [Methylococcus]